MDNIKDIGDKVYIINAIGNNITLMQILIKFLMTTINFYRTYSDFIFRSYSASWDVGNINNMTFNHFSDESEINFLGKVSTEVSIIDKSELPAGIVG